MADKKILMVEGSDDEHVIKHICGNRNLPILDEITPYFGFEGLRKSVTTSLALADEDDIVGIVIDANSCLSGRWQSIRDKLVDVGYRNLPKEPDPKGIVLGTSGAPKYLPRAGVWIMPDNCNPGTLENFLLGLIPQKDPLLGYAYQCVADLPEPRRFTNKDESKALMHSWLAWQEEPGRPYGTSITAGFLDAGQPQADALVMWLKKLFLV